MFTQFFGNFLLNQNLVTPEQLSHALEIKKSTRLKLGVLAMNAGYMTSVQVDEIHKTQAKVDKRFGDIAIDMNILTAMQVDELLSSQKTGYLILGQTLVDNGTITNAQFEKAIIEYKFKFKLSEKDFSDEKNDKLEAIIKEFYHFDKESNADIYTDYLSLLFKNIIRFVGDDFTPLEATIINSINCKSLVSQEIKGAFSAVTVLEADSTPFITFASRFAGEALTELDDFSKASVGEFLNLHNGLFAVNMSNEMEFEIDLEPQTIQSDKLLTFNGIAFCIPISFSFGTVNFILANSIK